MLITKLDASRKLDVWQDDAIMITEYKKRKAVRDRLAIVAENMKRGKTYDVDYERIHNAIMDLDNLDKKNRNLSLKLILRENEKQDQKKKICILQNIIRALDELYRESIKRRLKMPFQKYLQYHLPKNAAIVFTSDDGSVSVFGASPKEAESILKVYQDGQHLGNHDDLIARLGKIPGHQGSLATLKEAKEVIKYQDDAISNLTKEFLKISSLINKIEDSDIKETPNDDLLNGIPPGSKIIAKIGVHNDGSVLFIPPSGLKNTEIDNTIKARCKHFHKQLLSTPGQGIKYARWYKCLECDQLLKFGKNGLETQVNDE